MKTIQRAFTLIELLVVIAIIAILAAILFPVFAQAKNAAKGTQSVSNIKQNATGTFLYAGDSDDVFPAQYMGGADDGWQRSWIMIQMPYTKSYGIFKDPSDSATIKADTGPKISYVANGVLSGMCNNTAGTFWKFRGVFGHNGPTDYGSTNWYENGTRSQTQINEVANTVMFATKSKLPTGANGGAQDEGAFSPWGKIYQGPSTLDTGTSNTGVLAGQKNGLFSAPDPTYKGFLDRYYGSGASPVAFTDGHAKMLKPEQSVDISGGIADANAGGCYEKKYLNMWDALR